MVFACPGSAVGICHRATWQYRCATVCGRAAVDRCFTATSTTLLLLLADLSQLVRTEGSRAQLTWQNFNAKISFKSFRCRLDLELDRPHKTSAISCCWLHLWSTRQLLEVSSVFPPLPSPSIANSFLGQLSQMDIDVVWFFSTSSHSSPVPFCCCCHCAS